MTPDEYAAQEPIATLKVGEHTLHFSVPNPLAMKRAQTLLTKEPITIRWIRGFQPGDILVDVGANVGMYTIFSAIFKQARVYSFEPESQNYALLNRNIKLNNLTEAVRAYPLCLSDRVALDTLHLSGFIAGDSCHSVGEPVDHNLRPRKQLGFHQGSMSVTLDNLVADGAIPIPQHIKIDVDGFEHKVIAGARETLKSPSVKTVLIEINTALEEHRNIIVALTELGFRHDPGQVAQSMRKSGTFRGVGEMLFWKEPADPTPNRVTWSWNGEPERSGDAQIVDHLVDRVAHASVISDPSAHMFIREVFPADFYREILSRIPHSDRFESLERTERVKDTFYESRWMIHLQGEEFQRFSDADRPFWKRLSDTIADVRWMNALASAFQKGIDARFHTYGVQTLNLNSDALLVEDRVGYAISPHTDVVNKLLTILFYLPEGEEQSHLGTTFYKPNDEEAFAFTSGRGDHYPWDQFTPVKEFPFLPNSALIFLRNDHSFHGVEVLKEPGTKRRLLILNVKITDGNHMEPS